MSGSDRPGVKRPEMGICLSTFSPYSVIGAEGTAGIELTSHEAEGRYKLKEDGRRFSSGSPVLGRQVGRGGGGS